MSLRPAPPHLLGQRQVLALLGAGTALKRRPAQRGRERPRGTVGEAVMGRQAPGPGTMNGGVASSESMMSRGVGPQTMRGVPVFTHDRLVDREDIRLWQRTFPGGISAGTRRDDAEPEGGRFLGEIARHHLRGRRS